MRDFLPSRRGVRISSTSAGLARLRGAETVRQAGRIRALLRGGDIRPKLELGQPDSLLEQDADRAADEVMGAQRSLEAELEEAPSPPEVRRRCEDCEKEVRAKRDPADAIRRQAADEAADEDEDDDEAVQAKADGPSAGRDRAAIDPIVRRGVSGGGRGLPPGLGAFFASRFGHDFSDVRIHTDSQAAASAKAIKARAYAVGRDVVFGTGQYAPDSARGRWLLAHELAHVVQGRAGGKAAPQAAVERDADRAATDVLTGEKTRLNERREADRPALFGEPQHVPEFTYIAGQNPRGDGFLTDAIDYHNAWRLRPRSIDSMQDIVNHLARGRGDIGRIRIVTHASRTNLFMAMFEGGTAGILEDVLRGFGQSAGAGMQALLGAGFVSPQTVTTALNHLRNNNPAVLVPFGLDQAGAQPAGAVEQFVLRSLELLMHTTGVADPGLPAADQAEATRQAPIISTALRTALDELKRQVQLPAPDGAGVTAQQADDLHAAILGINIFGFPLSPQAADVATDLQSANVAVAGNFYQRLAAMRARFNANSWIDIRGCRVGGTPSYMRAIQDFFGTGADKPHVSAPDWWQAFPTLGWRTIGDADIAGEAANPDVQAALDHWFVVAGIERNLREMVIFYLDMIIRAQRQEIEASRRRFDPSGLAGGLQLPQDLGIQPPLPLPNLELPRIGADGTVGAAAPAARALANPIVGMAQAAIARNQRELERIGNFTPEEKLRYYLNMALILPIPVAGAQQSYEYCMLHRLRNRAMDNWLGSQFAERTPGLRALQRRAFNAVDPRRVEAVADQDPAGAITDLFISPDTRYASHIVEI